MTKKQNKKDIELNFFIFFLIPYFLLIFYNFINSGMMIGYGSHGRNEIIWRGGWSSLYVTTLTLFLFIVIALLYNYNKKNETRRIIKKS